MRTKLTYQPVPDVGPDDVARVLERDFSPDERDLLQALIDDAHVSGKPRIILACLKVADGDLLRAKKALQETVEDWRDVIAAAEYPNYSRKGSGADDLSLEDRQNIYEIDWQQYSRWLHGDA